MSIQPIQKRLEGNWKQAAEAIVLAGGFGTRLREAVPDLPKCMAPVAGKPFLHYVIQYLRQQGIQKIIFSLGYMHEVIEAYLQKECSTLQYDTCIETEPLGTGGAIQWALEKTQSQNVLVVNGDSFLEFNLEALMETHEKTQASCTLALKSMTQFDRYGAVTCNDQKIITSFTEKKYYASGLINAGVYLIRKDHLLQWALPQKFSFEKDFLEPAVAKGLLAGQVSEGYFIDIGIPEDFERAKLDFTPKPLHMNAITPEWTLFLDRDGVINEDTPNSYVMHAGEFFFYPGIPEALVAFSKFFKTIVIVTNQRGVGRGLMEEEALRGIHETLTNQVMALGGRIDAIYFATANDNKDFYRKPNPGMALQAKQDLPQIDLKRSIMVGNNISDMVFGKNAGMFTVYLSTTNPPENLPHAEIDLQLNHLTELVSELPSL